MSGIWLLCTASWSSKRFNAFAIPEVAFFFVKHSTASIYDFLCGLDSWRLHSPLGSRLEKRVRSIPFTSFRWVPAYFRDIGRRYICSNGIRRQAVAKEEDTRKMHCDPTVCSNAANSFNTARIGEVDAGLLMKDCHRLVLLGQRSELQHLKDQALPRRCKCPSAQQKMLRGKRRLMQLSAQIPVPGECPRTKVYCLSGASS